MFRTRPLLQSVGRRSSKTTTGLFGLAVHPDPLPALSKTYQSNLDLIKNIPKTAVYRQSVEAVLTSRLKIVQGALSTGQDVDQVAQVETEIDGGQIEELIQAAEDELKLTTEMIEWKP